MNMKNRIKFLRESLDISQSELAESLRVSQQKISQFENQNANPNADEISELLKIFNCSFDTLFNKGTIESEEFTTQHLLITYIYNEDHVDPSFTKLTYGDEFPKASRLENLVVDEDGQGSYIFFHTTISDSRYITAYFYVKQILVKGVDDDEIHKLGSYTNINGVIVDDVIVVADRDKSKILTTPLLFDKKLALELHSLGFTDVEFQKGLSQLKTISDKTRYPRFLFNNDVSLLISKCDKKG